MQMVTAGDFADRAAREVAGVETTVLSLAPNASMTPAAAWALVAWIGFLSALVGGVYAVMGLWMILPFGGLEVLALAAAIRLALRQNRQRELLYFEADLIRIERGEIGIGPEESLELPRGVTRVLLEQGPYRNSSPSVVLSAPGLRASVGRHLSDEQRLTLYRRLQELIHPGWVREPDLPRTPTWPSFEK